MEKPEIRQVSVTYAQEGNTMGTTSDPEIITVNLEFQLGEKGDYFVVLKTKGWSIDCPSDIIELIDRTKKILDAKNPKHEKVSK